MFQYRLLANVYLRRGIRCHELKEHENHWRVAPQHREGIHLPLLNTLSNYTKHLRNRSLHICLNPRIAKTVSNPDIGEKGEAMV